MWFTGIAGRIGFLGFMGPTEFTGFGVPTLSPSTLHPVALHPSTLHPEPHPNRRESTLTPRSLVVI